MAQELEKFSKVRLLNWNLLHSLESSRLKKFHYCRHGILPTPRRIQRILEFIHHKQPDVICLQELDAKILDQLEPSLPSGLKPGIVLLNESLPAKDGCGVFFNDMKYELISSKSVRFCNVVDRHLPQLGESARSDAAAVSLTRALHRELKEKMNMAVMVRLRDRVSGHEFVACSSHLYWDPAFPDIKLLQGYLLAKEAQESSADTRGLVIGADLNSVPTHSGVYQLLMGSGTVDPAHSDHPVSLRSNKINSRLAGVSIEAVPTLHIERPFMSAMKALNNGKEPEYTNYTVNFKGCLDYVLLGGSLRPVSFQPLPSQAELLSETALPNSKWPSDHIPLVVDLEFS